MPSREDVLVTVNPGSPGNAGTAADDGQDRTAKRPRREEPLSNGAPSSQPPQTRKLATDSEPPSLDIPTSPHYHVSWMHAAVVTATAVSTAHGFVVTGDAAGVVKWWKRTSVHAQAQSQQQAHACLEFVKAFTAHSEAVLQIVMDPNGGEYCVSISRSLLKLYHVRTFDAVRLIPVSSSSPYALSHACAWFTTADGTDCVAVGDQLSGAIHIFAPHSSSFTSNQDELEGPVLRIHLHAAPVTCLAYNARHKCMISADTAGVLDVWNTHGMLPSAMMDTTSAPTADAEAETETSAIEVNISTSDRAASTMIGKPCEKTRNHVTYQNKMETDLYSLLRKKTHAIALAVADDHFAVYGKDHKVRIYEHATAKILVTLDERIAAYDKNHSSSVFQLDAMEYGKRVATEEELKTESHVFGSNGDAKASSKTATATIPPQRLQMQLLPNDLLILPCLMGIKIVDWRRRKLVAVTGRADAGQLRYVTALFCGGSAVIDRQMQLARMSGAGGGSSSSTAVAATSKSDPIEHNNSDALLIATAYNQRRIYVFSHLDPVAATAGSAKTNDNADEDVLTKRDVWNEAPTAADRLYYTSGHAAKQLLNSDTGPKSNSAIRKAILRTTLGDIHIQLLADYAIPKTLENFAGHCRSGYYDNVIFHRVIRGFMLQTGDPLGDGTGGESIWGGEFEDEICPQLRHDRPFTVSMANAGPGTNGSQFFITVRKVLLLLLIQLLLFRWLGKTAKIASVGADVYASLSDPKHERNLTFFIDYRLCRLHGWMASTRFLVAL